MSPAEATTAEQRIQKRLADFFEELNGRQPRWRYFEVGQTKFCWTTEPLPPDERYRSFVYQPEGKGSRDARGGWRAQSWKPVREVSHKTRRAAKARALRLYRAAKEARS